MDRADIYHSHPGILSGVPVFTGTRVPVDTLVQHLRAGVSIEAFLDDFPSVSRAQAEAFLTLALNDALDLTPKDAEAA
ncbi:MAG: DUF433 domain-containing protein [Rhodothermales bacterium]|nr:DUF433 domain-containing protein [Rhodothermales bacterium]MBO6778238.1 DUF433 domain-containing protein [Rhodothermales bacterium]